MQYSISKHLTDTSLPAAGFTSFNLAGNSDSTIFVKGLDSKAPEPLMRAAVTEAFSLAGKLLQVSDQGFRTL